MTYIIRDMFGNQKAQVITLEDWNKFIENQNEFVKSANKTIDDLQKQLDGLKKNVLMKKQFTELQSLKEEMQELIKDFKSLSKKKSKIIDNEIKLFQEGIKKSKIELTRMNKEVLKNIAEQSEQTKSFMQEQKKSQEQLIKNLNSEYLKKLKPQIKAEDIDTLKVLEDFQQQIKEPITIEKSHKVLGDIKEIIPTLNLPPKVRLRIFQERDTGSYDEKTKLNNHIGLRKVLRNIIDILLSGVELKDMKIKKSKSEQSKQEPEVEESEDKYGD